MTAEVIITSSLASALSGATAYILSRRRNKAEAKLFDARSKSIELDNKRKVLNNVNDRNVAHYLKALENQDDIMKRLERQVTTLGERVDILEAEKDALMAKYNSLQSEHQKLLIQFKSLENSHAQTAEERHKFAQELTVASAHEQAHKEKVQGLEKEIVKLKHKYHV